VSLIDDIINGGIYETDKSLIYFTVGGDHYNVPNGMTWGEWADSTEYNYDSSSYHKDDTGVYYLPEGAPIEKDYLYSNGVIIKADDPVVSGDY